MLYDAHVSQKVNDRSNTTHKQLRPNAVQRVYVCNYYSDSHALGTGTWLSAQTHKHTQFMYALRVTGMFV